MKWYNSVQNNNNVVKIKTAYNLYPLICAVIGE